MSLNHPSITATIHIGASTVCMLIMEEGSDGEVIDLDFLEKPLPLARDIFGEGRLQRSTIEHCVTIIKGFQQTLREMGGSKVPVRAVTSNNLTEASNGDVLINRLRIACNLPTEALDDGEMTRLVYLKTRRRLHDTPSMRKRTTLVAHVGPGNTRIILFRQGHIVRYNSYRLGTHRTSEAIDANLQHGSALLRMINEHATSNVSQIYYDFRDDDIEDLVLIGHEIQLLSPFLIKPDKTKVPVKVLRDLTREVAEATSNERVKRYQLDYHTAEAATPALAINLALAEIFELENVRLPGSDYERGLLKDLARSSNLTKEFEREVIRSSETLARRYEVNAAHAQQVATLCRQLFEGTQELHNLPEKDAFLLEVAAILHECGGFVTAQKHEQHSEYIIMNSEIFGLSFADKRLVALLSRYHRGPAPSPRHENYGDLSAEERIRVSKLAALLRVADALERTHSQRIKSVDVELKSKKAILHVKGTADASAERMALVGKGGLFEDIFGLPLSVKEPS